MRQYKLFAMLFCLFTASTSLAQDDPEVKAARAAAVQHNEAVVAAEARMERDITSAKKAHLVAVIAAKERLVNDLQRALRTAARNENTDNVQIISRQIKSLEAKIEMLKAELAALTAKDGALAGLDNRLVGYLAVPNRERGQFVRVYLVDNKGQAKVVADISDGKPGVDVGTTYQGRIVNGRFTINCNRWTMRGFDKGRTQQFHILANGQVEMRHDRTEDFNKNQSMVWHARLDQVVFASMDEVRAAEIKMRRGTDPPAEPQEEPANEDLVDPNAFDEEPDDEEAGNGFFGLEIE